MAHSQRLRTADAFRTQAAARGYKRGVHKEQDKLRNQITYDVKTVKGHDAVLDRYVIWTLLGLQDIASLEGRPPPDEKTAREYCLGPGVQALEVETVKDFMRFYACTSEPRIDEDAITVDSINSTAEKFFAGFKRVTTIEIDEADRLEVYHFNRTTLKDEGLVVKKFKPKDNFTMNTLTSFQITLWAKDDIHYIPERYRVQSTWISGTFCSTGARLGAFFTGGLRYKDIELVLRRSDGPRPWRVMYKLDQRWIKNNRDPEYIAFGTALREHKKFRYNDAGLLLMMALADGALFGIDSMDDLERKRVPPGDDFLHLRFKESALEKPFLRRCTMSEGVTDDPMPLWAFENIWKSTHLNAGFLRWPTIHAIRRGLGIKVEKKYTPVERAQLLTQSDLNVFGQSYLANCSSVDGQAAFLGESSDHSHIEYFQSIDRYLEPGLPQELPACMEDELNGDLGLCELTKQFANLELAGAESTPIKELRRLISNYRRRLRKKALRRYQQEWVSARRDWKILSDGRERPNDPSKTDLVQTLSILIPERGRLAQAMRQKESMSPESMWQALTDVYSLISRDLTVIYLPGMCPQEGMCPIPSCQKSMDDLPKNRRNDHIYACIRTAKAKKLSQLPSDIHYCHICFNWVVGKDEWESHCGLHLTSLTTKRCGTLSYGSTLIRPAYSPFRLGSKLPAALRLQSWTRDFNAWKHVNEELEGCRWPMRCPHPLCDITLKDDRDLQFHFIDDHDYSRTRPAPRMAPNNPSTAGQTAAMIDESETQNWKRKPAYGDEIIDYRFIDYTHPSIYPESPLSSRPYKKARCTSPKLSPPLPPFIDLTESGDEDQLDPALLPWAEDPTINDYRPIHGCSASETSDNRCFSHIARSYSSSTSPFGVPTPDSSGTMVSLEVSKVKHSSEAVDDDFSLNQLFNQFIRTPSPSPSPSPPTFTLSSGATSELGADLPLDPEPNGSPGNAHMKGESCNSPALEETSTIEVVRCTMPTSVPRIRLQVTRPKITLRLRLPTKVQNRTRKKMKGEKRCGGAKPKRRKGKK